MGPRQYNVTAYFAVNTDATTDQVPVRVELISASNPSYIVNHTCISS
jgi:sorbitol-specific phosphotransferase system component IIBC